MLVPSPLVTGTVPNLPPAPSSLTPPLRQVCHTYTFNPKCIKMGELYGEYNAMTNEWTDGLGSTLIRTAVADTTPDKKWVVFDGPVDAIWIENMNTGEGREGRV